jgi:hypothetical protein
MEWAMVKLSNLLKEISLAALLRELRLLNGQPGYRFCMVWFLVLTHIAMRGVAMWWVIQVLQKF